MTKRQILASLNNIANTLDKIASYTEANNITSIMKKLAQYDDSFFEEHKDLLKHYPTEDLNPSNLSLNYNDTKTIWIVIQKIDSYTDQIVKLAKNSLYKKLAFENLENLNQNLNKSVFEIYTQPKSEDPIINQIQNLFQNIVNIYYDATIRLSNLDTYYLQDMIEIIFDQKIKEIKTGIPYSDPNDEERYDYQDEDDNDEERY
jgi:hypothetical protein